MTTQTGRRVGTDEAGAVLFSAVLAMLMLSILIVAFSVLVRDETFIASNHRDEVQATFAAEAGSNHGRWMLAQRLRRDLPRQVALTARATMVTALNNTYNTPAGAAQFLVDMAIPQGAGPTFVLCSSLPAPGCPEPTFGVVGPIPDAQQVALLLTGTDPVYAARVIVGTHPTIPPQITNGGTSALFTYVWRVESSGQSGRALQQFVIHDSAVPTNSAGSFTIALNSSFVQYAHFIDDMDASQAWISFRHVYTGPVHTNNRFNILGNPTGPTFRSEATQTQNTIRFNNNGSTTTVARDSTANDWPLLGLPPGILCQTVDCAGLTRSYDFDPSTVAIDPIPFPSAGSPDRLLQITAAQGPTFPSVTCVSNVPGGICPPVAGVPAPPVIVAHDAAGVMNGGIYVNDRVEDLQLAATATGQQIIIETPPVASSRRRTVITENRALNTTTVERQCFGRAAPFFGCGAPRVQWNPDTTAAVVAIQTEVILGLLSPTPTVDRGMLFVNSNCIDNACGAGVGAIGARGTANGVRKDPSPAVRRAIDANTRLTIAADGDIYITGHLNMAVDPRGADGVFSIPIPGEADAVTGINDDNLAVQNTLGVLSWDGGLHLSSALNQAMLDNTLPAGDPHRDGNLHIEGMFMATNINGGASLGEGQIRFDDPNGPYRGRAMILGGVVQKTMGTFGSPGIPGTGYARDWVYDERFRYRGLAPPFFPGFPSFMASTSLGIDSYTWRLGMF